MAVFNKAEGIFYALSLAGPSGVLNRKIINSLWKAVAVSEVTNALLILAYGPPVANPETVLSIVDEQVGTPFIELGVDTANLGGKPSGTLVRSSADQRTYIVLQAFIETANPTEFYLVCRDALDITKPPVMGHTTTFPLLVASTEWNSGAYYVQQLDVSGRPVQFYYGVATRSQGDQRGAYLQGLAGVDETLAINADAATTFTNASIIVVPTPGFAPGDTVYAKDGQPYTVLLGLDHAGNRSYLLQSEVDATRPRIVAIEGDLDDQPVTPAAGGFGIGRMYLVGTSAISIYTLVKVIGVGAGTVSVLQLAPSPGVLNDVPSADASAFVRVNAAADSEPGFRIGDPVRSKRDDKSYWIEGLLEDTEQTARYFVVRPDGAYSRDLVVMRKEAFTAMKPTA